MFLTRQTSVSYYHFLYSTSLFFHTFYILIYLYTLQTLHALFIYFIYLFKLIYLYFFVLFYTQVAFMPFYTQLIFIFYSFCVLNKTLLGESRCLNNLFFLLAFLIYLSQVIVGTLPLTVEHLCDLQYSMPLHWSPGTSRITLTQKSRGLLLGPPKYPKYVPLLTYFAYFPPKSIS